ncbi:MAG: family 43 glycosylhydrolase, partial [Clostridia bacterium]|nr:family 43 glycosylhydrolase [Clostridia bacterium]
MPEGATVDYTGCKKYNAQTNAIFVTNEANLAKGQAFGDGSSPLTPMADLNEAISAANGKQIVVCGPIYLKSITNLSTVDGKTVITSKYMGIDYRDFADARIELSEGVRSSGETVYENLTFLAFERYTFVSAEGHKLTIGDGVECELYPGKRIELYPSLVGGSHAKTLRLNRSPNLTVKSGTWGDVSGGSYYYYDGDIKTYTVGGDINLTITGGKFTEGVYLGGRSIVNGNASLTVLGGEFDCSVYGSYDGENVLGDVTVTLDGGEYHGDIGKTRTVTENNTVGASFTVNMVSGNFDRVSQIKLSGCNLNVSSDIDLNKKVSGNAEFTNPIANYADPSVIYHGGWYYYSFAKDYLGLPAVWIAKAANIYDLGNVEPTLVWAQALSSDGAEIVNLWAPQLYNFDGKWYLYTTCDIGLEYELSARRMPVIWTAKTSDPVGEYTYHGLMNNLDTEVYSYLSPRFIEMDGKRFMICGGFWRKEDKTATKHLQRMFIGEMSDPLTLSGKMSLISSPQYDYEGGIMEGPFPVK